MASIFEIERRKKFAEEFPNFFEDLKTEITIYSGKKYTVWEYLNYCIRYWPYRCTEFPSARPLVLNCKRKMNKK